LSDLNGLFILYSVKKENPSEGTYSKITFTSNETYGYGYFTLNNRFRIRIKYLDNGFNINRDEIGSFTLNNNKINMTVDTTGESKESEISFTNNTLTVVTDFTEDKGYILTMELKKQSNILNKSNLNILAGWNLITVSNFIKPIEDFNAISSSINTVWKWKGNSWQIWSPNQEIMNLIKQYKLDVIKEILAGEGFWINSKNSSALPVDNFFDFKPEMIFKINSGWNLVGVVSDIVPTALPISSEVKTIWQWDANNNKWRIWSPIESINQLISEYSIEKITTLKKLEGFWVNK
jgi:hypothetical protein